MFCDKQESCIAHRFLVLKKKLWCCVGGRDENKNLVLSNKLMKVELPP